MIATPATAINAGINFRRSKSATYPLSFALSILVNSAIIATKMQLSEHITHALLGVVVMSPTVCPKYPNATHDPQTI
ncbi:hypothetical protein JZU48_00400, partial [bacterium]|nr:hypothetical protein [bacterium]